MSGDREAATRDRDAFTDQDVGELVEAMRRAGVRLLEVEGPGRRLSMTLEPPDDARFAPADGDAAQPTTLLKADSMGHFRIAHPDGLFPTCKVGTEVARAQILGFVQIGSLLLPVTAPRPGRLARVLAAEDSLVGYGTPLFEIDHGLSVSAPL